MASVSTHKRKPGKRGNASGWSPGAARRNTAFLRSVDETSLDGIGLALTLTLRNCPESKGEWQAILQAWIERQKRAGVIRLHWVMEFQRRGVPHLHVAAWYEPERIKAPSAEAWEAADAAMIHQDMRRAGLLHQQAARKAVADWLEVASSCEPGAKGQQARPIDGPVGWFQYLAKHCGRGRNHYQRQQESHPEGWEGSPRVWGRVGAWNVLDAASVDLTVNQFYRLRRLVRSQRVARARAAAHGGSAWPADMLPGYRSILRGMGKPTLRHRLRLLAQARSMLRCTERKLSEVRGISEWVTEAQQMDLLRAVG